jgi:hypothetical protein
MSVRTVVVIAKQPIPGRVKTRLIGACTPAQAAALAEAALLDTLAALQHFPCSDKVILLDGQLEAPAGWRIVPQVGGGLDLRLAAGLAGLPAGPAVLVGMDTPQLTADLLDFDAESFDACLGLAADGGFWAIGLADPARAHECLPGVPMSTDTTGAEQTRRLVAAGMSVQTLPVLTDVDTADSAGEVARSAPETRFAKLWQEIQA